MIICIFRVITKTYLKLFMNKYLIFIFVSFIASNSFAQDLKVTFQEFIKLNFVGMSTPLNTHDSLVKWSRVELSDSQNIDYQQIYNVILNENIFNKLKSNQFINTVKGSFYYSLFFLEDISKNKILFYLEILPSEYDRYSHNLWAKSFTYDGLVIDSLIVDSYYSDEGFIRKHSDFFSPEKFILNQRYVLVDEFDNVKRECNINFDIQNGKFYNVSDSILFDEKFYYINFEQVLEDYKNSCMELSESEVNDVDSDGLADFVAIVKKSKICNGADYDLIIGINNAKGVFRLISTQGGVNLNQSQYYVGDLSIESGVINFKVRNKLNRNEIRFYYKYDFLINNWKLYKHILIDSKGVEIDTLLYENGSKINLIFHSADIAKKYLN